MGDFATTTSISELLPRTLVGNSTTSDTAGANIFSRHIDRAENTVRAMIGVRYDVSAFRVGTTTTNVPPLIRTLTEDMASYYFLRGNFAQDGGIRQEYFDDFKNAQKTLEEIREGKQALLYTDGTEVAPRSSARYLTNTDYSHIFNLDDPSAWAVDVDQESDIDGTR